MAAERSATNDSVMSRAAIEAMFAKRHEAYDNLDAAALAADYADDAVIDSPISGRHGKADVTANLEAVFNAFLDMTITIESRVIDGNDVAEVLHIEGSNVGRFFGLPPSGKAFTMPAIFAYQLRNGQIVRERRVYDFTGLLVQLGVLKAKPA